MLTGRIMEKKIIAVIKSLDKIMDAWDKLTLRRTIVNIFTIVLFTQVIITTILWIFGRNISTNWLGMIGIEFGAWGTILAYYFNLRGKADEENIRNNIEHANKEEEQEHGE